MDLDTLLSQGPLVLNGRSGLKPILPAERLVGLAGNTNLKNIAPCAFRTVGIYDNETLLDHLRPDIIDGS